MGEGGGFPAATRAVAEWFPVHERSTAMGIINAGTAVGGVIAPPLIALVLSSSDWRTVFYLTARRRHRLVGLVVASIIIRPSIIRGSAPRSAPRSRR